MPENDIYDEIRRKVEAEQAAAEPVDINERFGKPPGNDPDAAWKRLRKDNEKEIQKR